MKKYFMRATALILALITVLSMGVFANALNYGQALWSLDEETGHLTVYSNVPYNDRFQDTDFFRLRNVIKSVSFTEGVTAIEKNAFRNCVNIESIQLPKTLEFIGPWAFSGCKSLKSIELPGSVTYIGTYSFSNCAALKDIVIPPKVTVVSEHAFSNCINLENAEIMNGKTSISSNVFFGCKNLKNVIIPENARIDSQAFLRCENIDNVYYCGDKASFDALEINTAENYCFYYSNVYFNQPAAVYPADIRIGSMPQKTEYEVSEELDLTGFALSVEMSDGTIQMIDDLSQMYIHGFSSSYTGEGNVTVEYYGYKINIPYIVFENPEGNCGENATWFLDIRTNTLTISGSGNVFDYRIPVKAPWDSYREKIKTVIIDKDIKRIGLNIFLDCNELEAVYYLGTMSEWRRMAVNKTVLREVNLYINGEFHEHSFTNETVIRKPSCTHSGTAKYSCECGDFNTGILPALEHTPGEWETDNYGKLIKVCTGCRSILETKEPEPEETTPPEEIPDNVPDEPAEEQGTFEQITEIFEKIAGIFESVFGFISQLFKSTK